MLGILLGAGFSKWSVGLPVARELFDFHVEPWGPREARKLEALQAMKQEWDISHPEGLAEHFISDMMRHGRERSELVTWYVVRRLSDPFIWSEFHAGRWRRHVLEIDEHRKYGVPGITEARSFLQKLHGPDLIGVITLNYDLIVEYALGTRGFTYGLYGERLVGRGPYPVSQWANPVMLTGAVPLLKLHGSISWDENARYSDGRRGLAGHAYIVPPSPEKRPSDDIAGVWRLAGEALHKVTCLIVFGVNFNAYDEAFLSLLHTAASNVETVLLIDVVDRAPQAKEIWPRAILVSCLPPPQGNETMRAWQSSWLSALGASGR